MTRYSEDWDQVTDLAQRKKIQNRIAQRTYRNKLKRRIAELEQLNGVSNGRVSFPPPEHDEEVSSYRRKTPSTPPNNAREIAQGIVTPQGGDVGAMGNRHAAMNGGSHHRNQFSEPPARLQDKSNSPPYTVPKHSQKELLWPNSQTPPTDLSGTFVPQAVTASGVSIRAPSLPNSTSPQPNDMNSVLGEPQPALPSVQPYDWTLNTNNDDIFFPLLHNQPSISVTSSTGLLNLNATAPPAPSHLPQPSDDRTTLHLAVDNNHLHIVQLLLARHADIMAQDRQGHTVLQIAAIRGHEAQMRLLLSAYSSSSSSSSSCSDNGTSQYADLIEITDATGYTALHHAAENGHAGIVNILTVAGANPRAQNKTGATPLHLAISKGHEAVVVSLLLSVTTKSSLGSQATAMLSSTHLSVPADINVSDDTNNTKTLNDGSATISSVHAPNFETHRNPPASTSSTSSRQDNNSNASWSPRMGASICDLLQITDNNGATPIHIAAESGYPLPIISILLAAGAPVNILDTIKGFSPLHYAAQNGHESVVGMLLESGADPQMKARCGWNALHLAVHGGHDGVVTRLLERGAEVNERVGAWNPAL